MGKHDPWGEKFITNATFPALPTLQTLFHAHTLDNILQQTFLVHSMLRYHGPIFKQTQC